MGFRYYYGDKQEKNQWQAFTYWKIAADQGDLDACKYVYECYRDGTGVEKNPQKAEEYKKRSKGEDVTK
jgi:TPR repeat protein